jgi:hypothetical protein
MSDYPRMAPVCFTRRPAFSYASHLLAECYHASPQQPDDDREGWDHSNGKPSFGGERYGNVRRGGNPRVHSSAQEPLPVPGPDPSRRQRYGSGARPTRTGNDETTSNRQSRGRPSMTRNVPWLSVSRLAVSVASVTARATIARAVERGRCVWPQPRHNRAASPRGTTGLALRSARSPPVNSYFSFLSTSAIRAFLSIPLVKLFNFWSAASSS